MASHKVEDDENDNTKDYNDVDDGVDDVEKGDDRLGMSYRKCFVEDVFSRHASAGDGVDADEGSCFCGFASARNHSVDQQGRLEDGEETGQI